MKNIQIFSGIKYIDSEKIHVSDELAIEEILNIYINSTSYTMTMRTPGNEEELVRGILLSENVYDDFVNPNMNIIEVDEYGIPTILDVEIPLEKLKKGIETKRNLLSVSSCGMCGKKEMDLTLEGEKIFPTKKLKIDNLTKMFHLMFQSQEIFKKTGGVHAASIIDLNGTLLSLQEDIGRHNAVDKAIGSLLMKNSLNEAHCLMVSGRVSYEIVSKCFRAKIPYLAAVSAPSSLAVEYCQKTGITLLAFCRENKATVYTYPQHIE